MEINRPFPYRLSLTFICFCSAIDINKKESII